jgi:multisubunit Na+/H+ antiporter MnhE subunit
MRIKFLFLLIAVFITASVSAQLAVAKIVGKNADKYNTS